MENMIFMQLFLWFFLLFHSSFSELTFKYVTLYNKEGKLMGKSDLQKDSVNVLNPIIFVINGLDSSENAWVNALVEEYLHKQTHNVFLLDLDDHKEVDTSLDEISTEMKDFMEEIYRKTGETYLRWRLIGTAATGFQVTMDVGRKISNNSTRKVSRITGLDPTYHSSQTPQNYSEILDDSANLVDVVHSNAWKFDKLKNYGHVDFYVVDKNCQGKKDDECGHLHALEMFKRAVNSEKLSAVECSSVQEFENNECANNSRVLFGENMPSNADGIYIIKHE